MKRFLFALLIVSFVAPVFGAMTYDQAYYQRNRAYLGSGNFNDPLYQFWGTVEALYEGTNPFDAIELLESVGATYYTKIAAGNQSANLTLTLPTGYAAVTGYVLSSTDAGVLSWVANAGTFAGGNIASDVDLSNGVDITSSTTTAHTNSIQGRDIDGAAYVDVLRWTNGNTVATVLGAATESLAISSTGLNVSTAGAVTGVSTLSASGTITATGGVALQNGATLTNSIDSEITMTDTSEDLTFDMDSASNVVGLKSSTGVNGIAFGTVDDLSGIGTIAFDAAAASITTATTAGDQDLTIGITGAQDASLILSSTGTGADALQVSTSAGGIDLTVAGGAAGEDLDLTANTSINIKASEASADDSIVIQALGAASGIDIISLSDIDITTTGAATEDISITNTGGSINIRANENDAGAIVIDTAGGGGTSEVITILNDQGTAANSIDIDSSAGTIDVDAGDDITINAVDDLTLNGGSAGSIINVGTNTNGNVIHIGDNDTTADAITIGSAKDTTTVAGIATTIGSTGTTSATILQSGTGDLALTSTDDITLTTNTTTTDNITITNTPGTATNAIAVQATAGGIDIDCAAAKIIDIDGGTVTIDSKTAGAGAIALTANQGATDTITVTNTQGNTTGAITLTSTAGGITMTAGTSITIDGAKIQYKSVALTNGNIKALRGSPFTLIAAGGANTFIEVVGAVLVLNYGTNVLTETTDNLVIEYASGQDITGAIESTGFIDAAADTLCTVYPVAIPTVTAANSTNSLVRLLNTGDGEFAGNAGNDTTMNVLISYRVWPTGL